jgi:predicted RNase H-like HicB family nuclease
VARVAIKLKSAHALDYECRAGLRTFPVSSSFAGMNELVFQVTQEGDGGYVAEALGESIFTQGDTWEELRTNVQEAVKAFYFDRPAPKRIRLHLVRDEVIA